MGIGIGSRVGPYEVVAPLGAGGMGEVYRAHDARLNRDVALGPEGHYHPHGWSADGAIIAGRPGDNFDLLRVGTAGDAKIETLAGTPVDEGTSGAVSPDGRWVAYSAEQTGRGEIWVRRTSGGAAIRVSPNGGFEPVWSADGRELFYLEGDNMMATAVDGTGDNFNFTPPSKLFSANIIGATQPPSYDVLPDGRFVMFTGTDQANPPISVLLNWWQAIAGAGGR